MMYSAFAGDGLLGTEIDDKIVSTLALGKTVVVTGWNIYFPFPIIIIITILTGDLVENTVIAAIGHGLLDVEIDDKLESTWALEKTWAYVATIGTVYINANRSVTICSLALGYCLSGSIEYLFSSFFSSSVVLSW